MLWGSRSHVHKLLNLGHEFILLYLDHVWMLWHLGGLYIYIFMNLGHAYINLYLITYIIFHANVRSAQNAEYTYRRGNSFGRRIDNCRVENEADARGQFIFCIRSPGGANDRILWRKGGVLPYSKTRCGGCWMEGNKHSLYTHTAAIEKRVGAYIYIYICIIVDGENAVGLYRNM